MTAPKKIRIDQLLVERGLAETRTKAQSMVMAGLVYTGEQKINKAGDLLASDAEIHIKGQEHPWVSRGGMKLAQAITHFNLIPKDAIAVDVGASTGGFTDVLLARGAARVFAVDTR